ncbi:zinc finger and SCAN domain-containing protein 4 [Erinaceus europaeus]|uniref:Zinc finger and SCAN domain-containing protein 4 n=1 Tax=Erinaceus europaeus TaxID=9365 RepID=A0ABM3W820_ERIEU|nr:zinc finger and SCAN domain-containing protein 4 [Erinaceus europaeus]
MQGQEALFTENMPLREVISLLREQLSAGTQTKEDIMTASRMFRDAPLETEQGDEHGGGGHVSLIIYGVEDSDVSEGSKTPSLLIMEENCLQLEENSVSLEGELSSRPDPNTSRFRDASPGGLPGQREPDPAEQNVAAESCTQGEQEEEEEENYTVSALHRCEHCPKTFKYPSRLKAHLRKHRNERTYFCKECHKGFFQFSDLREHKKIHSGVRPFSCSMCGVAFTYKTNLQAHERIHTGEKPYMCLSCCKSYRQSSTYHRHLKTHKKNKPVLSGSHQGPGDDADDGASTSRDGDPGFHP